MMENETSYEQMYLPGCAPDVTPQFYFELKQEHIDLLCQVNFETFIQKGDECCDPSFWMGFSNADVMDMLGYLHPDNGEPNIDVLKHSYALFMDMQMALKIIMRYRTFKPGIYEISQKDFNFYARTKNFIAVKKALTEVEIRLSYIPGCRGIFYEIKDICRTNTGDDPWVVIKEFEKLRTEYVQFAPTEKNSLKYLNKAINIFKCEERIQFALVNGLSRQKAREIDIEDLNLSNRAYKWLKRAKINTLLDLFPMTEDNLICIRNIGMKSAEEIITKKDATIDRVVAEIAAEKAQKDPQDRLA